MVVKKGLNSKLSTHEKRYWEDWQNGRDPVAGDYLVRQYLPLVDFLIDRFMISLPKSVDKDDIRSLAYEGLLDALEKFNIQRDLKFETYATWRIKGAIIDGLRHSDWLPRSVRDKVKKIEKAYTVLEQQNNSSVTDEEVSAYLGITKAELNKTVSEAALSAMVSIDETAYDDNEPAGKYHMIEDTKAASPEKHVTEQVTKAALTQAIEGLPEKEKLVVSLCYFEELKLTEIAEVLSVSVSRVSQLHSKAMLRLNAAMQAIHEHSIS
ncbi:FliA/WhiG family RNA polymerase sigma factor [Planomicrobium sp. CPCC 101079]|uniref:FliA/WhiG family RNA polymerase sigma factor n=1 Tax=Planomicrobium sp. CPCC 101079 TaxID=2599618 RepID=UPI0011B67F19|nr:FliA/WhiG family RNA polymerase sigma factor [Planomicrobium sp. CPCC 101079]TWT03708.1 FliA/WhiG family RNA polymerase sigma factor [Planomicrobium sp. CPCC 101079]